jgi:hypothetical protein
VALRERCGEKVPEDLAVPSIRFGVMVISDQLDLIGRVHEALGKGEFRWWLFDGWGSTPSWVR